MRKILGREPAVFFSLLAGLVLAVISFVDVPPELYGALNGLVLAAAGFATAASVSAERALPALVGLVQAVFAVFLAYGSPVSESTQTGILAFVAAAAAWFVRQNVVAPYDVDLTHQADLVGAAYDNGFEAGQDAAVPATSGVHGLTEVLPAVRDEDDNTESPR